MNNNNAPFYVGQKVVRTGCTTSRVVNGEMYVVKDLVFCNKCRLWFIDILPHLGGPARSECICGAITLCMFGIEWYNAANFAPIDERTISIPESLKEQAEEMIQIKETIQQPETQPA